LIHSIGELKLVKLKDARIMELVGQLEKAQNMLREMPNVIASRCAEICRSHDCRCAADEISREFKLSNGGHH
jgi:hypothetical protein